MKDLSWLREQGKWMNEQDEAELKNLTIEQGLAIFGMLYQSSRHLLEATEQLYRPQREKYLTELQARMARYKKWEQRRDRPLRKRSKTTEKTRQEPNTICNYRWYCCRSLGRTSSHTRCWLEGSCRTRQSAETAGCAPITIRTGTGRFYTREHP